MTTNTAKQLADNTKLEDDWDTSDGCPVHGTECRKVYEFGLRDAEIAVFSGCRCAVATQFDPCGILQYAPRYFRSYNAATGLANLVKAVNRDKFGGLCG